MAEGRPDTESQLLECQVTTARARMTLDRVPEISRQEQRMGFRKRAAAFLSEECGVSAIEFALITPMFLSLLGLVLVAGEGFAIQRKVNMTARTLVDLAARSTDANTGVMNFVPSEVITAAWPLMAPYKPLFTTVVLSEMRVVNLRYGYTTFSKSAGTAALPLYQNIQIPNMVNTELAAIQNSYILVATVTYKFRPFGVNSIIPMIPLSRTIYMPARNFNLIK